MWIGFAVLATGCGLLVLLNTNTSIVAWVFVSCSLLFLQYTLVYTNNIDKINLTTGIGLGCLFTTLSMAVQAPQHKSFQGHASALSPFFRAVGQAFGIAVGDAVYQNALKHHLRNTSIQYLQQQATSLAKDSARLVVILRGMRDQHAERLELLAAFDKSLHALWYLLMGIAASGLCLSLLLREFTLDDTEAETTGDASGDSAFEIPCRPAGTP